ncbi:hypothetical protein GGTG_04477 [Gaeumannomyces tritici R3-111a-1]|uniref:Uncharacterized protein n=1 Tax=Gaeumannomyces tritici (strain R3-111a-1) TaxID=644352 RepID=J3NT78_GAET3|nr:hypothetical protein GGTG_04477 [Gaeumannomyces tritici R3-111a-1]EJT79393.1 hypothetical protein GGTG_04477 [Gaeumannomyces tritici R3-111a-1]
MVESAGSYLNLYTVFTVTSFFAFENKFVIANIFLKLSKICGAPLVFYSGSLTAFSNVLDVALSVIINGTKLQMPFSNLLDPFRLIGAKANGYRVTGRMRGYLIIMLFYDIKRKVVRKVLVLRGLKAVLICKAFSSKNYFLGFVIRITYGSITRFKL